MTWLDALGGLADALIWLMIVAVEVFVVGQAARRVLGVRVGWPRTIVVCAIAIITLYGVAGSQLGDGMLPTDPAAFGGVTLYLGVLTLWTFAFSAAALVVLEIIVPTGSLPTVRQLVLGWDRRWARWRRYLGITGIAAKHGLGAPLRGFRPAEADADRLASSLRQPCRTAASRS